MSGTTKTTPEARDAINKMQTIIDGGLSDQINDLNAQGLIISDPQNFDGGQAAKFRGETWPQFKGALDKMKTELADMRTALQSIEQNVTDAGN